MLYALGMCPALIRYLDDGHIEFDNSAAKCALRGVALGRRNFLLSAPTAVAHARWPCMG